MVRECLAQVLHNPAITEIVISDDASTDGSYEQLKEFYKLQLQVKLFRNERNLDCYANKAKAVERATNKWVILFDSDNVISTSYVDNLLFLRPWVQRVAYLPVFAKPHFDYTKWTGQTISKQNVAIHLNENLATALNTANYFFHRDEYLRVWDGTVNPHTADSIYQNYRWLEAGNLLYFVPGLHYFHRVHVDSHYKKNVHKTGNFAKVVEANLRNLK